MAICLCAILSVMTYDRKQLSELNFIIQQDEKLSKEVEEYEKKSYKVESVEEQLKNANSKQLI